MRRWEERETIYFFGKQENKTKLTVGPAQAWEAWRKMRRVLGKKVEVEEAGTVKSHKSRLFEIENKTQPTPRMPLGIHITSIRQERPSSRVNSLSLFLTETASPDT